MLPGRILMFRRPAILEEEAIFRAICLAEVTGCPLYIPHVTAERALRPIRAARERGQVVYGETCAHYLSLTRNSGRRALGKSRSAHSNGERPPGIVAGIGRQYITGCCLRPCSQVERPARRFHSAGIWLSPTGDPLPGDL